jgi:hypothetical protein
VTIHAHLHDPQSGQRGVSDYGSPWKKARYAIDFWTEGNGGCDCNRADFLWRANGGDPMSEDAPDFPCGEGGVLLEKLVDGDTGAVLWTPESEEA